MTAHKKGQYRGYTLQRKPKKPTLSEPCLWLVSVGLLMDEPLKGQRCKSLTRSALLSLSLALTLCVWREGWETKIGGKRANKRTCQFKSGFFGEEEEEEEWLKQAESQDCQSMSGPLLSRERACTGNLYHVSSQTHVVGSDKSLGIQRGSEEELKRRHWTRLDWTGLGGAGLGWAFRFG